LSAGEFEKIVSGGAGENVLIDLNIENGGSTEVHRAMIKDVQTDPVKGTILHVDLYAISMDKKIQLEIPILLTGTPVGVSEGGILQQVRRTLEVSCLPGQIPDSIELDVSILEIGDSLHVDDLKIPEGVEVLADEQLTIATVIPPTRVEELEPEILEEEEMGEREEVEAEQIVETEEGEQE
jgi:large subunit ribosomal protein L25